MLIGIFYSQIVESSSLVSVLFREAISHPYISFFHLLVNGFSVIRIQSHIVLLYINIIVPSFNVTHNNFYVEATHSERCTLEDLYSYFYFTMLLLFIILITFTSIILITIIFIIAIITIIIITIIIIIATITCCCRMK